MDNEFILPQEETARQAELILQVLFKAFRLQESRLAPVVLHPFVWGPAYRFARLCGESELAARHYGLAAAGRRGLREFARTLKVSGNESIPDNGPLLIVSNHVGAFDILVILSQILRKDLKAISSDVPFLRSYPILTERLFYTNFQPGAGMQAARQSLRHLKDGGALLLFASAGIDPDPALDLQGARRELNNWKTSLDIFLRQVPETQVVVSIVSGVVSGRWAKNPLTRIGKRPIDKRRIGEILQIVQQLVFPGTLMMEPRIQFSPPLTAADLEGNTRLALIRRAEEMLDAKSLS
jgi:hypothetical protein